ncbi:UDP-glucose:glycoprotein glucosyltransferase 1-like [Engraulis encrasicolus]|uniref:UDP-glucose:glycoprotein glucosyltransferase 1-like n=1 Tax=Engraulis encrasicolus TaxID=184585 RepID=UPI002FCFE1F5
MIQYDLKLCRDGSSRGGVLGGGGFYQRRARWYDALRQWASDLVMKVDALLSSQPKGEARIEYGFADDRYSAVKLRPKEAEVYFDIVAVVDPVTRDAQKLAPLLLVLKQLVNVNLRVFMNCQARLSDMPLKSFYRYVLESQLSFGADNSLSQGPLAKFLDMPQTPLFTLNLNTPESWMVESVRTRYDLDNIYLEEVDSVVPAEYELEYLLLEGHCFDVSTGQPPRGLQFTLGTDANPVIKDTIVMANLGYFQLKANPGAWVLKLRKGRSEDIYKIYSHDGTDSPADADDLIVVLNNFKSKIIKVKVQKKPDKMNEELLSDGTQENDSGFWESLTRGFTGGSKTEETKQEKDDVINIFSLASGHLYERFLRIMMLSVLKNTKTPVKFWFLKNYLSPTFKEFIPYMAEEYGFQYELIQYKWPRWLHQQTEKQRIIWGYKILFLDVLFPLAVDKILFVDADQIVRTDLKELRDFDLEGAPYGYTPFCDSRREMDGYRFWKSGYWASHLAGRKYHISALYVVDLKKFRKIAAGDRLRGQYQGLSQDPNSLSNLDQDLPNNMIHQVPIKSLPQEWLWCETWCDDSTKKKAKTIDLCNNPQTKEPKLHAAVRIVSEWSEYDQEVKRIQSQFQKEKEAAGGAGGAGSTDTSTNTHTAGFDPHIEL